MMFRPRCGAHNTFMASWGRSLIHGWRGLGEDMKNKMKGANCFQSFYQEKGNAIE